MREFTIERLGHATEAGEKTSLGAALDTERSVCVSNDDGVSDEDDADDDDDEHTDVHRDRHT